MFQPKRVNIMVLHLTMRRRSKKCLRPCSSSRHGNSEVEQNMMVAGLKGKVQEFCWCTFFLFLEVYTYMGFTSNKRIHHDNKHNKF